MNNEHSIYRRVIADAFRVTLSHTHLWIFGVVVALTGFGGVVEVFVRNYGSLPENMGSSYSPMAFWKALPGLETMRAAVFSSSYPAVSAMIFGLVALTCLAVAAAIGTVGIAGLISSIRRIIRGGDAHFADGVKAGRERFWPVFFLTVGQKAAIAALMVVGGANLMSGLPYARPFVLPMYVATYVFLALLVFLVIVVTVYATCYAVVRGLDFSKSLQAGWKLLRDQWLVSIEMIVVLLFLDIVAGALSLVLLVAFASPAVILFSIASLTQMKAIMWVLFVIAAAAAVLSAVLLGAFYATLRTAAWTILWSEIAENKRIPKLQRLANWLKNKVS